MGAKIVTIPQILRTRCKPVEKFDRDLEKLVMDLTQAMMEANGLGLAAPQIGVDARVAVVNRPELHRTDVLINPTLYFLRVFGRELKAEGCLSIPGQEYLISRWTRVRVNTRTLTGGVDEYEAKDLHARVIQHETDHLDGVLIIHRALLEEHR